jgi:hypothetical protein
MPKRSKRDLYTRKYRKAKAKKCAAVLTKNKSVPSETKRTLEGVGHDSSFSADGKTADQEIEHALLHDETNESQTSHEPALQTRGRQARTGRRRTMSETLFNYAKALEAVQAEIETLRREGKPILP